MTSFLWGIFIFKERISSIVRICTGIFFLVCGLIGTTYFSAPEPEIKPMILLENEIAEIETIRLRESLLMEKDNCIESQTTNNHSPLDITNPVPKKSIHMMFMGFKFRRYTLGLLGAVIDGICGGCTLVPMHYSK